MPVDALPHWRANGSTDPGSASDEQLSHRVDVAVAALDAALYANWPYARPYLEAVAVLFERLYAWQRVPLFPNRGTLLGCARNGTFLEYDIDVDFGIMRQDLNRLRANKGALLERIEERAASIADDLQRRHKNLCTLQYKRAGFGSIVFAKRDMWTWVG